MFIVSITIFMTCLALLVYHYLLFPLLIYIISLMYARPVAQRTIYPHVSMIIAAYMEAKVIGPKLENSLALDYPRDCLDIIVASDGDEDNMEEIVKTFSQYGIISSHCHERKGKMAAINRGVAMAGGEIILLSDANSVYPKDTLMTLVRNFADPEVGAVSGRKSIIMKTERESSAGDSAYWRYESFLKTCQSKIGSITTGDGEIFAFRKSLFKPISENIINDDTAITIEIIEQGYRVVYEPEAISLELASIDLKEDFWVKVRMVAGGFQSLKIYLGELLRKRPLFALQFLSHKALRWMAPLFLLGLFVSNLFLMMFPFFIGIGLAQIMFYGLAMLGLRKQEGNDMPGVLHYPYYFCLMNTAAFLGMIKYIKSETDMDGLWKRARR